jgi:hypothetical protein
MVMEGEYGKCILHSLVEIILRKGKEMRENNGGVNLIKIHCKHKWC